MRQREKRSKRAAKPSSASGGSSTEPWPTAWKKPAIGSSLSRVCRRANGAAFAPRMQSNGYTRNSSAGSRRRPCCRRQTPPPCCSGRCSLPVRSTCARSMDGKPLLQNPSISQLTSQLDPIPSLTRRLRRAKFQPHHGRHPLRRRQPVILEALSQGRFLYLAGRGVGDVVNEHHVIRHPPIGDLATHKPENVVLADRFALLHHNHQQRALVPFGMANADHGSLRNLRMADCKIFEVDRRDPFPA